VQIEGFSHPGHQSGIPPPRVDWIERHAARRERVSIAGDTLLVEMRIVVTRLSFACRRAVNIYDPEDAGSYQRAFRVSTTVRLSAYFVK
jgi:hypothetical protein